MLIRKKCIRFPYAGVSRFRFLGYDLSPLCKHPQPWVWFKGQKIRVEALSINLLSVKILFCVT